MSSSLRAMYQRFKSLVSALIITPVDDGEPYFIITPKPLVPFGYSNNIENNGNNLYYSNNLGVREKLLTPSSLNPINRASLISFGGDFISINTWNQFFGITVPETGYYRFQFSTRVLSNAIANNQVRISQNGNVIQYNNGLTPVNALDSFITNATTQDLFFWGKDSIFHFTEGLLYSIDIFTDNAQGWHNEGIRTYTIEKVNYNFSSSTSNAGGGA